MGAKCNISFQKKGTNVGKIRSFLNFNKGNYLKLMVKEMVNYGDMFSKAW